MDYSLAALKIFGSQLAGASEGTSTAQMLFREAGDGRLVLDLDDCSCLADLSREAEGRLWQLGMYVMVIGACIAGESKENYAVKGTPAFSNLADASLNKG